MDLFASKVRTEVWFVSIYDFYCQLRMIIDRKKVHRHDLQLDLYHSFLRYALSLSHNVPNFRFDSDKLISLSIKCFRQFSRGRVTLNVLSPEFRVNVNKKREAQPSPSGLSKIIEETSTV